MKPKIKRIIKSAAAGAAAGIVNGFIGFGGGLILVPLLTSFLKLPSEKALPSSVAIILPLCIVSVFIYTASGFLDEGGIWPYLAGGILGGFLGGMTFGKIEKVWLRRILGVFIVYGGIRALFFI